MALPVRRPAGIAGALVLLVAVAGAVYATVSHSRSATSSRSRAATSSPAPAGIPGVNFARDGVARVESTLLVAQTTALRVGLAAEPIDRENGWLYHKTTHREAYERARRESPQFDEVILWNSSGEVTEATTANVVVELAGNRLTPPVASGLLAGTFRAELLQKGAIEERVVTVEDLRTSSRIWLINSVHEWREATLHM